MCPPDVCHMAMWALSVMQYTFTGATDGIGKHTATKLAKAGATVIVHGRCRSRA